MMENFSLPPREGQGLQPDAQITPQLLVQHIFRQTSCYELMQMSSKGTVFETSIPFQLAFFALIEHDTDVAPLWDPNTRSFVGLFTVYDYVRALRVCQSRGLGAADLTSQTLADILQTAPFLLRHTGFPYVEAEDNIHQLCQRLVERENDYVCVLDPETHALVSVLAPLDVLYLCTLVTKANDSLFATPIERLRVGTWGKDKVVTVTRDTMIGEVLQLLDQHGEVSAAPVLDGDRLVGIYHRSDVSFAMKAPDVDSAVANLRNISVGQALQLKEQLLASGDLMSAAQGLVTCKGRDSVASVIRAMAMGRAHRAVIVEDSLSSSIGGIGGALAAGGDVGGICGIITFRDILRWMLDTSATVR